MRREPIPELLAELAFYVPVDAREGRMVERLRSFLAVHENAFDRKLEAGHVTGSAWVVDRCCTLALLTQHRKLGRWLQLGGHADGERDVRRVALREAREESGLASLVPANASIYDIDVHAIPERASEPEHLHFDVRFAFFADPAETPRASAESHAVAWVSLAEIERYAIDDSVRRLALKTATLVTERC